MGIDIAYKNKTPIKNHVTPVKMNDYTGWARISFGHVTRQAKISHSGLCATMQHYGAVP